MDTIAQLGGLRNVPIDMTLEGLAALNRNKQQEEIGLQELMRTQRFNTAADPMRLEQMQTANEMGLQGLHSAKRANREQDQLSPARVMSEYSSFLAKASANDITMAEDRWRQLAMSNNPEQRALGVAGLQRTKEFVLQKQQDDAAMARTRAQGANQLEVAKVGAASRERTAAVAAEARRVQATAKTPKDWEEYAVRMQQQMLTEPDENMRAVYAQQITLAQQMAERLKPPQQQFPGIATVDPRGPIPTQPPAQTKPTTAQPAQHSLTQLRGMYPGRSDADIKAAYKARFGVEPK